jgi:hypothetical protein
VPAVTALARAAAEIALMLAGMTAIGYAVYLDMIHAVALRWWDRILVVGPVGLVAVLGAVLLVQ